MRQRSARVVLNKCYSYWRHRLRGDCDVFTMRILTLLEVAALSVYPPVQTADGV